MCIDSIEIWFQIANGHISSIFDRVICPPHDCSGVLSFLLFICFLFCFQECVPENIDLKKKVFSQLDGSVTDDMILASSSSCLCASMFADGLKHRENILVAHPVSCEDFIRTFFFYSIQ